MKICFYGVGGVGGYFGAIITNKFKGEHDIYFIARGEHKKNIQTKGLTLKKAGGDEVINVSPKVCTDSVADLPICDIVVLSVKVYDLEQAVIEISKISNDKTIVLPLLNGVDIYDRIRKHFQIGIVLPSCVYVGTHIESPGTIYQKGGSCKISIGKDPNHPEIYPKLLLSILEYSKINFEWEKNVQISIWLKYMFIAAFGLVSATYEKTIGEILEDKTLSDLTKMIMSEINEIAKRLNIPLNANNIELSFKKAHQFPFEAKTSFQRDVEKKGKINEGDLFAGTLIRYGKEYNISTSNVNKVYNELLNRLK